MIDLLPHCLDQLPEGDLWSITARPREAGVGDIGVNLENIGVIRSHAPYVEVRRPEVPRLARRQVVVGIDSRPQVTALERVASLRPYASEDDCRTVRLRLLFRGDAAFAKPELYEYLEEEKTGYAIRLPANQVVQEQIQPLLEPPTEWPSREPMVSYHDFAYQAQSWRLPRRVVAKVEWHRGELFPRVGFIVTNLSYPPKGIVRFYNGRGTAEQWIKEGKYALNWTRLSCHKFVANQVRLWLFVLTYNLGNFMRRLVLPEDMKHWSLTSLQTRLIKTGGRLVLHARRLVFQLAEVLVTREMLTGILERISRLRLAPG